MRGSLIAKEIMDDLKREKAMKRMLEKRKKMKEGIKDEHLSENKAIVICDKSEE